MTDRWWFASTGIPLLSATLGPLANVSSVAALVTNWRQNNLNPLDNTLLPDLYGIPYPDPRWCYALNAVSLACGFLGNLFLLFNFTQKIPYRLALPATIFFWSTASGLLIALTACIEIYAPPNRPFEIYTQGYWYAVAAAVFYFLCAVLLAGNMLGCFLGRYPDRFVLTGSQRTLILQTMFFFIWIAGGAAMYGRIQTDAGEPQWTFTNALYFCYVTILTVGFGDLVPTTNLGRGLLFPYSVGGIITLGLIVASLYRAARELSEDHIIQKDMHRRREQTLNLTVTNSLDYRLRERQLTRSRFTRLAISKPSALRPFRAVVNTRSFPLTERKPRVLLLKEEKDRFDAMRRIQADSKRFRRWMALIWSVTTFLILWCVGAVVFWQVEKHTQSMTYFQALYFCYISLLTIGYGDLSPQSNPGRCFFVIWSLISVPTMTILVSDLSDTVVAKFNNWSNTVADFTVLPKRDIWLPLLDRLPWLKRRVEAYSARRRVRGGFDTADPDAGDEMNRGDDGDNDNENENDDNGNGNGNGNGSCGDIHANDTNISLTHALALAIRQISLDISLVPPKRYTYREWTHFTDLLRATHPPSHPPHTADSHTEDPHSPETPTTPTTSHQDPSHIVDAVGSNTDPARGNANTVHARDWDWLGARSPMVANSTESEWLLGRLVEGLIRVEGGKYRGKQGDEGSATNEGERREGRRDEEKQKGEGIGV